MSDLGQTRDWKQRCEAAERERDAANLLLHGLTNEPDANAAWKALILRAEKAESEAGRWHREALDWQQAKSEADDAWQNAEARVAALETALAVSEKSREEYIEETIRLRDSHGKRGPDDPAGCPAGHGVQCCGWHDACRAALASGNT